LCKIDTLKVNEIVIDAHRQAASALKEHMIEEDEVNDLLAEMQEVVEQVDNVDQMLTEPLTTGLSIDEDELAAELEALESELTAAEITPLPNLKLTPKLDSGTSVVEEKKTEPQVELV
jgi:hypothetical protein